MNTFKEAFIEDQTLNTGVHPPTPLIIVLDKISILMTRFPYVDGWGCAQMSLVTVLGIGLRMTNLMTESILWLLGVYPQQPGIVHI